MNFVSHATLLLSFSFHSCPILLAVANVSNSYCHYPRYFLLRGRNVQSTYNSSLARLEAEEAEELAALEAEDAEALAEEL